VETLSHPTGELGGDTQNLGHYLHYLQLSRQRRQIGQAITRTNSRPGRGGQSIAPDFSPGNNPPTLSTAGVPAAQLSIQQPPAIHHPAQYPSESPAPPQSKSPIGATDLLPWTKRDARLRRAITRSPWTTILSSLRKP